MDSFNENDVLYVILEDLYSNEIGKGKLPVGWYSVDIKKRIDILKEALEKKKEVIDTSGYYDVMEKVIDEENKNTL